MKKLCLFVFLFAFLCLKQAPVFAAEAFGPQDLSHLMGMVEDLQAAVRDLTLTVQNQNEVIERQHLRIQAIESGAAQTGLGQTASVNVSTGMAGPAQKFNPEIGVAGTVQAKLTENSSDGEGNDAIALKELEISFAQVVDPYSRLDAILTFNDNLEGQNADIEEAYYTRWGLPLGITAQLGKFRSKIGKQNLMHTHQLTASDYPLVIQDFFGEEGLSSSGIRLQTQIANPWDVPLELTGEVLRGNNGASFSGVSRRPIFNTHVKTYFETTADSGLELGWTTLFGDENISGSARGEDRYGVSVFGADATWSWFLADGRKVQWQNEIFFQNRTDLVHNNRNPWGFYSQIDYRISKIFGGGVRFDYLQPLDEVTGENGESIKISPYLIFYQSEFADFKLQFSHLSSSDTGTESDNMIFLTADFLIGAHRHPVQ